MSGDWVEDDDMSAEETMDRFRALHPERTVGPLPRVLGCEHMTMTGVTNGKCFHGCELVPQAQTHTICQTPFVVTTMTWPGNS